MGKVASSDGTPIAFDTSGDGPPLIIVDGALAYREVDAARKLGSEVSRGFTVYTHARRGRGEGVDASAAHRRARDPHGRGKARRSGGRDLVTATPEDGQRVGRSL